MSIDDKLDKIAENVNQINVTLALQHQSLDEHMKRTKLLEDRVDPIEKQAVMFRGVVKFFSITSVIIGIITSIIIAIKTH